eukprot:TRINITY_DN483_c0_g1_i10.p1 TRINITY_DN483_c0_g1~~TRINITY_DN483_c0_g1_i10.p1  ORF type:complete len:542 (+),score=138.31 TRINITY_DN483_c0_g1_i10:245-1870(+)
MVSTMEQLRRFCCGKGLDVVAGVGARAHDRDVNQLALLQLPRGLLRGLTWRALLVMRDKGDWDAATAADRQRYAALCRAHLAAQPRTRVRSMSACCYSPQSATFEHPLMMDEGDDGDGDDCDTEELDCADSDELQQAIVEELSRTFADRKFFQRRRTRRLLCRILRVYAREHPTAATAVPTATGADPAAAGGSSSLSDLCHAAAVVLLVVTADSRRHRALLYQPSATGVVVTLSNMLDPRYVEHDSYALLECLVERLQQWHLGPAATDEPEVAGRCIRVMLLLHEKDQQLATYLELNVDVIPCLQQYVRLLMCRVVQLEDLLPLWDAIFSVADETPLLVEHLCVCMLFLIRDTIIGSDAEAVQRTMLLYPRPASVQFLVHLSLLSRFTQSPLLLYTPNRPKEESTFMQRWFWFLDERKKKDSEEPPPTAPATAPTSSWTAAATPQTSSPRGAAFSSARATSPATPRSVSTSPPLPIVQPSPSPLLACITAGVAEVVGILKSLSAPTPGYECKDALLSEAIAKLQCVQVLTGKPPPPSPPTT